MTGTSPSKGQLVSQDVVDLAVTGLLESDALTANAAPSNGLFTVHEDDLEHLVRTVLTAAAPDVVAPLLRQLREEIAHWVESATVGTARTRAFADGRRVAASIRFGGYNSDLVKNLLDAEPTARSSGSGSKVRLVATVEGGYRVVQPAVPGFKLGVDAPSSSVEPVT